MTDAEYFDKVMREAAEEVALFVQRAQEWADYGRTMFRSLEEARDQ